LLDHPHQLVSKWLAPEASVDKRSDMQVSVMISACFLSVTFVQIPI
jgi:hypothetical protein